MNALVASEVTAANGTSNLSRRAFLVASGALVVAIGAPADLALAADAGPNTLAVRPPVSSGTLSSYISIEPDGTVVGYYGKIESGQGLETSISQVIAEEIDVPWNRVRLVMGDTALTVDMGGATAGNALRQAGPIMRQTAAEARRLLVEMASRKLGVPAAQLTVTDGVVHAVADANKRISYAELIGGRHFDAPVEWDGVAQGLTVKVQAPLKKPAEFKVIGKPHPRRDMPGKVFGTLKQVTDVRLPNMLHGRTVRPTVAGAVPVTVDETSIANIPGAQVVWIKNFLAVVAEKEWNAVKAAKALKVTWSEAKPNFPTHNKIHDHIRNATPVARSTPGRAPGGAGSRQNGNIDTGFRQAVRIIEADYEYPMQSHASMGPACAVADVREDGVTVWTSTQKPYDSANSIAELLELPPGKVRAIWMHGTGSYARNDQGDAVGDAALLSRHLKRPVRVQYMRHEGFWDPKGSAQVTRNRAGLDASGKIIAFEHLSKAFSKDNCNTREQKAGDLLAGMLTGAPLNSELILGIPGNAYVFDNAKLHWEVVAPLLDRASPLRTTHVRDPFGTPHLFGMESFMDEVAAATNTDPVEFRMRYLTKEREFDVVKAATEKYGWDKRTSPRNAPAQGDVATGRGFAYRQMHDTFVAMVIEVAVHRDTGVIDVERMVVAHDCGQIVNPQGIRHVIERQLHWQLSRTMKEELQFDENMVTSVDWVTYPVLKMDGVPKAIDIVLIDRPGVDFSGASEHSCGPISAAMANAVFDATGVRIRHVPFTPQRVLAALNQPAVKAAL